MKRFAANAANAFDASGTTLMGHKSDQSWLEGDGRN
jgi:hypothetical protein